MGAKVTIVNTSTDNRNLVFRLGGEGFTLRRGDQKEVDLPYDVLPLAIFYGTKWAGEAKEYQVITQEKFG